ncbi:hypothetical protein ABGB09_17375 [Streptomyces sp. B8F3]|uniref:hypothetical protein n=1 Tax=Streptomyces sp. B8F3 TaxID=3153573 RepID=UPI00325E19B4
MEPYAAHHELRLADRRQALAVLDETLPLSATLLTGDSPREALLAAAAVFRAHMRAWRADQVNPFRAAPTLVYVPAARAPAANREETPMVTALIVLGVVLVGACGWHLLRRRARS